MASYFRNIWSHHNDFNHLQEQLPQLPQDFRDLLFKVSPLKGLRNLRKQGGAGGWPVGKSPGRHAEVAARFACARGARSALAGHEPTQIELQCVQVQEK